MTSPCGLRLLPALWRRSLLLPRSRSQRGSLLFRPLSTWRRRTVRLTPSGRRRRLLTRDWRQSHGPPSRRRGVGVGWGGVHIQEIPLRHQRGRGGVGWVEAVVISPPRWQRECVAAALGGICTSEASESAQQSKIIRNDLKNGSKEKPKPLKTGACQLLPHAQRQ